MVQIVLRCNCSLSESLRWRKKSFFIFNHLISRLFFVDAKMMIIRYFGSIRSCNGPIFFNLDCSLLSTGLIGLFEFLSLRKVQAFLETAYVMCTLSSPCVPGQKNVPNLALLTVANGLGRIMEEISRYLWVHFRVWAQLWSHVLLAWAKARS